RCPKQPGAAILGPSARLLGLPSSAGEGCSKESRLPLGSVGWLNKTVYSFHLLVLQQSDVQVSFGRARRASDVAQPGGGEVQGRLAVGECPDHTRASPE